MPSFDDIVSDFEILDDWEERYKYVIDLGRNLDPLAAEDHIDANKVRGCVSQVWLKFALSPKEEIIFHGDSDAHIVKGLIALLVALFSGQRPEDILKMDAKAELARLDLQDHITPQRSNGLAAMIKRITAMAELQIADTD